MIRGRTEPPLPGVLWLHLRIRYYEVAYFTQTALLGGMGIVFDHLLLEMLRGIIIFLCKSFESRYRHHCMKEISYSKCFDAEKMAIRGHVNAAS